MTTAPLALSALRDVIGPVRQIGFVTADARRSAQHWCTTKGIGPWLVLDPFPVEGFAYLGTQYSIDLVIAVSFSGDMQIEFIQQRNAVPSLYRGVATREAGAVMHHGCHFPLDFTQAQSALKSAGHQLLQDGGGARGRFAYFRHPAAPSYLVEIAERTPLRMRGFERLRDLCAKWEGERPIRDQL